MRAVGVLKALMLSCSQKPLLRNCTQHFPYLTHAHRATSTDGHLWPQMQIGAIPNQILCKKDPDYEVLCRIAAMPIEQVEVNVQPHLA